MADRAPKRSYISMRIYNNDFFSYTTRVVNDFQTVGILGAVTGANAGNCPQGRILTETGRKLYPGANPGITHLMVGVFDYATGLGGFIDPNSSAFTPQNTDRPYYFTSPGANTVDPDPDRAPPVFTRGDVLAQGNFDLSGSAHIYGNTLVGGNMDLSGSAQIYGAVQIEGVTTMNSNVQINGNLDLNGNLLLQPTQNVGIANMTSGTDDGSFRRLNVTTSAYNSNSSYVFLTLKGLNTPGSAYSAEPIGLNTFQIVSNSRFDQSIMQWLVVN
jgi:hypothetical protein